MCIYHKYNKECKKEADCIIDSRTKICKICMNKYYPTYLLDKK